METKFLFCFTNGVFLSHFHKRIRLTGVFSNFHQVLYFSRGKILRKFRKILEFWENFRILGNSIGEYYYISTYISRGGGTETLVEIVESGARNNPLKFPPPKPYASLSVARISLPKSVFLGEKTAFGGKCQ